MGLLKKMHFFRVCNGRAHQPTLPYSVYRYFTVGGWWGILTAKCRVP